MLIHQYFEKHANQTPDKLAVLFDDDVISYSELNRRANCVAYFLIESGVKPDTMIPMIIGRSIEMMVALLGILKAGAAYVPIDPQLPIDRIKYIFNDLNADILLTSRLDYQSCSNLHVSVVQIEDVVRYHNDSINTINPAIDLLESNLAYVIYTSGTSGVPKGVLIEHKGITNLANAQIETFQIKPESTILQFASISFDASVSEWSTTFKVGATLCMPNIGNLDAIEAINLAAEKHKFTIATLPPSFLTVLPERLVRKLKTLIVAGEPCKAL